MKLKTFCFIMGSLIFFGCGTYSYLSKPQESPDFKKYPENKQELQDQVSKHFEKKNGRKG